jgi:hypothetical protein
VAELIEITFKYVMWKRQTHWFEELHRVEFKVGDESIQKLCSDLPTMKLCPGDI